MNCSVTPHSGWINYSAKGAGDGDHGQALWPEPESLDPEW
jgi:hypothetical protein